MSSIVKEMMLSLITLTYYSWRFWINNSVRIRSSLQLVFKSNTKGTMLMSTLLSSWPPPPIKTTTIVHSFIQTYIQENFGEFFSLCVTQQTAIKLQFQRLTVSSWTESNVGREVCRKNVLCWWTAIARKQRIRITVILTGHSVNYRQDSIAQVLRAYKSLPVVTSLMIRALFAHKNCCT